MLLDIKMTFSYLKPPPSSKDINKDHPSEQRVFLLTWVILRIFELKMR